MNLDLLPLLLDKGLVALVVFLVVRGELLVLSVRIASLEKWREDHKQESHERRKCAARGASVGSIEGCG